MKGVLPVAAVVPVALTSGPTAAAANDVTLDRNGNVIALDRPGGYARPRQIYAWHDGGPITIENPDPSLSPRYVTAKFHPSDLPDVRVRIANGGAGAAGPFRALA